MTFQPEAMAFFLIYYVMFQGGVPSSIPITTDDNSYYSKLRLQRMVRHSRIRNALRSPRRLQTFLQPGPVFQ